MITVSLSMTTITCCREGCGIVFAVPVHWDTKRREDHSTWYCPNGHSQLYKAETEAERLKKQLAQERAAHDQTQAALREKNKEVEHVLSREKRLKSRVGNGVCPCCKRSFANLRRHMKTKHGV